MTCLLLQEGRGIGAQVEINAGPRSRSVQVPRMRSMQGLGPCRVQVEVHAVSRLRSTQNPGRAQVGLRKIFRMQDLFEEKDQEW